MQERIMQLTDREKLDQYKFDLIQMKQAEIDKHHDEKSKIIQILDRKIRYATMPSKEVDKLHIQKLENVQKKALEVLNKKEKELISILTEGDSGSDNSNSSRSSDSGSDKSSNSDRTAELVGKKISTGPLEATIEVQDSADEESKDGNKEYTF